MPLASLFKMAETMDRKWEKVSQQQIRQCLW